MKKPNVVALILTYNDSTIVSKCIKSIQNSDYEFCEIYLIDNGSKPNFLLEIREAFPTLKVFVLKKNIGYSGAFNFVIKEISKNQGTKISYFWLLNNDIEVEKDALSKMISNIQDDYSIGFAGPETFKRGQKSEHDQWITYLPDVKNPGKIELDNEREYGNSIKIDVEYVVGHCLLIKSEVINSVGLMRDFFLYYEEIEWQHRSKINGWRSVVIPGSVAYHDRHSFQKPFNTYLRTRNFLFYNRVLLISEASFFNFFIKNLVNLFKEGIISIIRREYNYEHAKNFIKGIFHGLFKKLPAFDYLENNK